MEKSHSLISESFTENFKKLIKIQKVESIINRKSNGRGAPARIKGGEIIMGLVYHFFSEAGTLGCHVHRLLRKKMSDSALTQRRKNLPFEIFQEVMKYALKPIAKEEEQPDCFYNGLRMVAVDGTQFSAPNTSDISAKLKKAKSRREESGFAKIGVSVLLEVGTHHPIAAAIAEEQEGEVTLTRQLLKQLPAKCLLIADRLLGVGALVEEVIEACKEKESFFLIRARENVKRKTLQVFGDGSSLIEINLRDKEFPKKSRGSIIVRQIKGRVSRSDGAYSEITLWTNLDNWKFYPALEILSLYGKRWEQELYYKELKIDLHKGELLQSQTLITCLQEIAALILASAILSQGRLSLGKNQEVSSLRISFILVREHLNVMWLAIQAAKKLLSQDQLQIMVDNMIKLAQYECLIPPRRSRSCTRGVRQPIKKWKRLFNSISIYSSLQLEIISNS